MPHTAREDFVQDLHGKLDASVDCVVINPFPELRYRVQWVVHVAGRDENVRIEEIQHFNL